MAIDGVVVSGSRLYNGDEGAGSFEVIIPPELVGSPIAPDLFVVLPSGDVRRLSPG